MKKKTSSRKYYLTLSFFLTCLISIGLVNAEPLTILHTNDWQSRLLGFGPNADFTPESINDDKTKGGVSRLATLIEQRREAVGKENMLLLDGGDYSMGTLFNTIIRETGAELQLMSLLQYDAITFGNHEFDYRPDGLAQSIESALTAQGKLPPIVISNMVFSESDPADDQLQKLWQQGIIKPYIVLNRGKQKIGIFGLMGLDAADVAPNAAPLTFSNPVEAANKMVKLLKEKEQVDLVIVLSHGGVIQDDNQPLKWRGDDIDLLTQVPGIDIIVGGHSHTPLEKPITKNGRFVVQAGSESQYLGELSLDIQEKKIVTNNYQLHVIDDKIMGHDAFNKQIDQFKQQVTDLFLEQTGYQFDQELAQSYRHLSRKYDDHVIGNLVSDAMRIATQSDIALTASGSIRDEIYLGTKGIQRVSDLFRVVPLGVGVHNQEPGYDLMKVWVTGKEIKNVIEVMLLGYQQRGSSYFPRFSGFQVIYNTARLPFDQITQIKLGNELDGYSEIDISSDNKKLYSVAANSFVGSLSWLIGDLSYGLLDYNPKGETGKRLTDLKTAIYDSNIEKKGIQEIKEWKAFFTHLKTLPDSDQNGIVDLPSKSESRLIKIHSFSLSNLYHNATWIMYTGTFIFLLSAVLILLLIRKIYFKFVKK